MGLEFWSYYSDRRENGTVHEKRRSDAETGAGPAGGPPLDAPAAN